MKNDWALHVRQVNHTWPSSGTRACVNVSLNLHPGSVNALVGENGAGKTTLGHVLAGVYQPNEGRLIFDNREIDLSKYSGGIIPGIGLVRQKSIWPPTLRLWEAAVMGREKRFQRSSVSINNFRRIADEWEIPGLDPRGKVDQQDATTLQRSQLAAALMDNPKILILDEPATGWEEGRAEDFFNLLKRFKHSGMGVLLITHRLNDVFRIADYLTVMHHGRVVSDGPIDTLNISDVTARMFGDEDSPPPENPVSRKTRMPHRTDSKIAALRCESVNLKIAGKEELRQINFNLHTGEILSITGLREEGLAQLENILSGHQIPTSGKVLLTGKTIRGGCAGMRRAGLGYVPSDTLARGTSLTSTVAENMMALEAKGLTRRGWLYPKIIRHWAEKRCREDGIVGLPNQRMEELSGGNIQKVILQRELEYSKGILLLVNPAMGLDERSRQRIQIKLKQLANQGKAILILTTDLSEAMESADRMAVLSKGCLSPVKPVKDWERYEAATRIANIWKESD